MVQSLVFKVGMPIADYNLFLAEEGKTQHGWSVVVDWVGGVYVRSVCKAKICRIADVD